MRQIARFMYLFMFVFFAALAIVAGLGGAAVSLALLIALLPFMGINYLFHQHRLRQLLAAGEEEDDDPGLFGPQADVTGFLLRVIPILPFFPALAFAEGSREFLASAQYESTLISSAALE